MADKLVEETGSTRVVGRTDFGTELVEVSMTDGERRLVRTMAATVMSSRALWEKILPSVTPEDRRLYEVLFETPYPAPASFETVFRLGQCHRNAFFAAYLLNDRSASPVKYELAWNVRHAALRNRHTGRIMDPSIEAHPAASPAGGDWRESSVVMLMWETLGRGGAARPGIPVSTFEEARRSFGGAYARFIDEISARG